jgi:hypothetical protein
LCLSPNVNRLCTWNIPGAAPISHVAWSQLCVISADSMFRLLDKIADLKIGVAVRVYAIYRRIFDLDVHFVKPVLPDIGFPAAIIVWRTVQISLENVDRLIRFVVPRKWCLSLCQGVVAGTS